MATILLPLLSLLPSPLVAGALTLTLLLLPLLLLFVALKTLHSHLLLNSLPLVTRIHYPPFLLSLSPALRTDIPSHTLHTSTYFTKPLLHIPSIDAALNVLTATSHATGVLKLSGYDNFKAFTKASVFTDDEHWKVKRHTLLKTVFARPNDLPTKLEDAVQVGLETLDRLLRERSSAPANLVPIYQQSTFQITHTYLLGHPFATPPATLPPLTTFLAALTRLRLLVLLQARTFSFTVLPAFLHKRLARYGREISHLTTTITVPYARHVLQTTPATSRLGCYIAAVTPLLPPLHVQDYLVSEVTTLLFAGLDTSSGTLSFASRHLLDHAVTNPSAFIKETMRLTPVAEFIMRPVVTPVSLAKISPDFLPSPAPLTIPAGVLAVISIKDIHTNPAYYSSPLQFIPSRWDAQPHLVKDARAFMPFGAGSRGCIGSVLGRTIVESVFNHVLDHYIFEGKADAAVSRGFTTLPVSVLVSVRRREAGDPSMRQAECR